MAIETTSPSPPSTTGLLRRGKVEPYPGRFRRCRLRGTSTLWSVAGEISIRCSANGTQTQALLAAFASHQVDEQAIEAFRSLHPAGSDLVGALALASFAAARRIGAWIACPDV